MAIEISDLKKVKLDEDDIILVQLDSERVPIDSFDEIREVLSNAFKGHTVLVIPEYIRIAAIKSKDITKDLKDFVKK